RRRIKAAPGIDLCGEGGYVIVPPGPGRAWLGVSPLETGFAGLSEVPAPVLEVWNDPRGEAAANESTDPNAKWRTQGAEAWAEAALAAEVGRSLTAPMGARNDTLNRAAFALGQIVAGGALAEDRVTDGLMRAALATGLGEAEARATIRSGLMAGARELRLPADPTREEARRGRGSRANGRFGEDAPGSQAEGKARPDDRSRSVLSEDLVARRFTEIHAADMRHDHDRGCWYAWTSDHWQADATGFALDRIRALARYEARGRSARDRVAAGRATFVAGAERLARSDRAHAVRQEIWDRDPFLLGVPGGTVDLKTGAVLAPDPDYRITRQAGFAPAMAANCPRFLTFIDEATGGDAAMVAYLRRLAGYALTGDTREHALAFLYGPGGNGKSVLLNVLTAILGDYAATACMDAFTAAHGERHPADIAMLRGARLVTASETEEGRAWAESRIKALTGGEPVTARFMRENFFTFRPTFKLLIAGNHKPVLRNVDDAARRRFHILPFLHQPEAPDRELEAKLLAEGSGILRWAIDGCLEWQRLGLAPPASVRAETEAYFGAQDLVGQWLEERCVADPGNPHRWEETGALYTDWRAWAEAAGEKPGSQKAFGEALEKRSFAAGRRKPGGRQVRVRIGVSLLSRAPRNESGDAWRRGGDTKEARHVTALSGVSSTLPSG
ncbi:MAG TPA: phage/plasmid primase, P4 family, partial [Paracoccaceae bacterium]|nr:phage/plasmid primase, P4 family [Paracoccaceae bacterium]